MDTATRLREVVARATPLLLEVANEAPDRPLGAQEKWSDKETLGHLIDSASNNHQRFVRAQFSEDLIFPGYDQEQWVRVQQYTSAAWGQLVTLWSEFNLHLARVMENIPSEVRTAARNRHNLDEIAWRQIPKDQPATLDYFMSDYVDHLEHHLGQILPELGAPTSGEPS